MIGSRRRAAAVWGLVFVVRCLPGCGSDGAESSDDVGEPPAEAHYTVPVASDLGDSATYPVTSRVLWKVENDNATLRYRLPADLVGDDSQGISMTGPWNAETSVFDLAGAMGTAHCRADEAMLHCEEELPGIHVDLAAVERRLANAPDQAARLEVSRRFIGDPIGVLEVRYVKR